MKYLHVCQVDVTADHAVHQSQVSVADWMQHLTADCRNASVHDRMCGVAHITVLIPAACCSTCKPTPARTHMLRSAGFAGRFINNQRRVVVGDSALDGPHNTWVLQSKGTGVDLTQQQLSPQGGLHELTQRLLGWSGLRLVVCAGGVRSD